MDDNKFLKNQVKDAMKHNKLLEVALNKTDKQTNAIKEFLKRNKQFKARDSEKESNGDMAAVPVEGDGVIREERSIKELDKTEYEIQNFQDMEEETDAEMSQKDLENHDQMVLANLNIMKENMMAPQYQMKQTFIQEGDAADQKTFFT